MNPGHHLRSDLPRRFPGDRLLDPIVVASAIVLIINDHVLKSALHNSMTGKLSDAAGLVLLPVLIVATAEAAAKVVGARRWQLSTRALRYSIAVSAFGFAAVKTSPALAGAYGACVGAVRSLIPAVGALLGGEGPTLHRVSITADATDLVVLPALWLAWYAGRQTRLDASAPERMARYQRTVGPEPVTDITAVAPASPST